VNLGLVDGRVSQVEPANTNRGAMTIPAAMLDDLSLEPPVLTPGEAAPKGTLLTMGQWRDAWPEHWKGDANPFGPHSLLRTKPPILGLGPCISF